MTTPTPGTAVPDARLDRDRDVSPAVLTGIPWAAAEPVDEALVRRLRSKVARQLADAQRERERQGQGRLIEADEHALGAKLINEALERHAHELITNGVAPLTAEDEQALEQAVFNLLFGLGRLQDHLDRADVVNIHAAGAQRVWLDLVDGRTIRGPAVADTDEELIEFIRDLGRRVGLSERLFDPAHPRINLQLPDGSRLFAIGWVCPETHLFLRLHRLLDVTLDDLAGRGSFSPMIRAFLGAAVRARANLLICGGMGDGKTTLLRALAADIAPEERLVTVETDYELALDRFPDRHNEVVALESREANVEDVGRITCADLVRWAMRMNARRVIVGEVLGDEVVPMLNAMNSGASGSMCTLHANSSAEVFNKLALLAAQSPERLEFRHTFALAADAVNFTIFVRRDRSGHRVVSSIREVTGASDTAVVTNELFAPDSEGRVVPTGTVLSERTRQRLREQGFDASWLARHHRVHTP
ncbi:MAG: pilus assembly protein CpaF [Acidimicrobiaceae bacterium]|nr:pilus assembly protein CpaF [Acidimicrobiaceae bacterium]